ncbi:hypothetical protein ABZ461_37300 [Actinacidiphila glaucinigra]|uniref:hypothetical protein n=1 Tax=Actinacidiphila glaucinigra TaxID=235986 RepID=UPI0033F93E14
MDQLAGVEIAELHNEYAAALEQLVVAKMTGAGLEEPEEPVPAVDLMAALEASIREAGGVDVRLLCALRAFGRALSSSGFMSDSASCAALVPLRSALQDTRKAPPMRSRIWLAAAAVAAAAVSTGCSVPEASDSGRATAAAPPA